MADIGNTRASLITASPDNTSGVITAQVFRNVIVSSVPDVSGIAASGILTLNNYIVESSGTNTINLTLPPVTQASGRMLFIKKENSTSNTLNITPSGSDVMYAQNPLTMVSQYSSSIVYSNGAAWDTIYQSDYLGWKDLTSDLVARGGTSAPTFNQVGTSGFYAYEFTGNQLKEIYSNFHVLHDYAPGTDVYIHMHWLMGASGVGGQTVQWFFQAAYAKGYNQGAFNIQTPVNVNVITATSGLPIYEHMISEVQLSNNGGSGGLLNSANLQTDGIIMVHAWRNGAGGSDSWNNSAWGLYMDLHYQVRKNSTLNKNYPFD